MPLFLWIILCAALGGIASAAFAVAFLLLPRSNSARMLPHFVSFATGALLGAALLGLLPEAMEGVGAAGAHSIGVALVVGLGFFFVIEKLVLWWHSQEEHHHGPSHDGHLHAGGVLVLVGDSIHNALDGILIAAAFLTDALPRAGHDLCRGGPRDPAPRRATSRSCCTPGMLAAAGAGVEPGHRPGLGRRAACGLLGHCARRSTCCRTRWRSPPQASSTSPSPA